MGKGERNYQDHLLICQTICSETICVSDLGDVAVEALRDVEPP